MKLTFIGSGSAFTMSNRQSNMILTKESKHLLLDCGSDARHSIAQTGFTYQDIDGVYISHLHADHIGGLEWLAFSTYFDTRCKKPKLYINRYLRHKLWSAISQGLGSLQGKVADLDTYFEVISMPTDGHFEWEGIDFQMVQTVHIMNGFNIVPSFGLFFTLNDKKIFITMDTQFAPAQINDFYAMADIIFHDCELSYESGVHAHYSKLKTLSTETKSKIWLYHHQDNNQTDSSKDGFLGFVKKGQVFE